MARILVSDDDPHVLQLVGLCLEHGGHDVVTTPDSSEVSSLAQQSAFDAVILDVMMAPMSGFDVLGELRNHPQTATVPVLFLSGRAEGSDRVRGLREGADDYLVKPFEPEELLLRIEKLVGRGHHRPASPVVDPSNNATRLDRYEVREAIGEGTMGSVYHGWDPRLHRSVALKTLSFDSIVTQSQRQEMLRRLEQEAITVAKFNHPNIVTVYDMGNTEDAAFIAMEFVDGVSLATYLTKVGRVPASQLIPLALGIARALDIAHERQIIHRDLKPANVLLGRDGSIKVTDFGLANLFSQISDESKQLCGTPGYVPPEALKQEAFTLAGDLFALGGMLYEAAAGVHPLAAPNLGRIIELTLSGRFKPLSEHQVDLPDELTHLVMDLLALDPEKRPTAATMVEVLEKLARKRHLQWSAADLPNDL